MKYLLAIFLVFFPLISFAQNPDGPALVPRDDSMTREFTASVFEVIVDEEQGEDRRVVFTAQGEDGLDYKIDSAESYTEGFPFDLKQGQRVLLQEVIVEGEAQGVFLVDVVRTHRLWWLFALFAVATIAIGLWRGALALAGLLVTLAILFGLVFPRLLQGADPVMTTVLASVVILAVNMHLTHGLRRQTFVAFFSTVIGLGFVVLFAETFTRFAHLTGLASEEAFFLLVGSNGMIDPRGILLAGIILGAVGVLDDIAITQTETVEELRDTNPQMKSSELFTRAMRIGRHHIASVVNTLVLAYAGVGLPLFLLFLLNNQIPAWRFLNEGIVAEEIVRTLAGTFALVLLVPISTWFATMGKKS